MNGYEQMREACANIAEYAKSAQCHTEDAHVLGYLRQMENWAKAALALPRRQCDVGTAEEQVKRFEKYCGECTGSRCDHRLFEDDDKEYCALEWGQMPYAAQEGGAAQ